MGARNGVFPAVSQPAKLAGAGKVRASWNRLTSGPPDFKRVSRRRVRASP